jgi:glyoxylase-like metal-dependent hydrolase (beta-lactamase superfamily II)
MAYTGDVERGGPAAERTIGPMTMRKVSVGKYDNNAYVLTCGPSQLLIDAAADAPTLLSLVGPAGLETVVTTHRHPDHWQALADVVGPPSLAHAAAAIPPIARRRSEVNPAAMPSSGRRRPTSTRWHGHGR